MGLENIEKLIRNCYQLTMQEERYGRGLLMGMDYTMWGHKLAVSELIDKATSPGDTDAMEAFFFLQDFAKEHEEFLYVTADNLEEGLAALEQKAILWNKLEDSAKETILDQLDCALGGEED